ncbi:hypothetical protein ACROYT_G025499 [Oculina patagonica]
MQIQRRLLSEAKLKYSKALEIAVAMETAVRDASELHSELHAEPPVDKISDNSKPPPPLPPPNPTTKVCYRCGGDSHASHNCRFKDQTCYHCGKVGHISRVCNSRRQGKPKQPPKTPQNTQVHTVQYSESDEFEDVLGSMKIHNVSKPSSNAIWVDLKVEGKPLKMELDTGSAVSIIPHDLYIEKFNNKPLHKTELMLKTYTGENIVPSSTVNPELQAEQYPLPRIEDIFAKLSGGQKFSKIDLRQAYHQLEMEEVSKKYLTINTHMGLFQYNRLVFGITSAPAIWQRTIDQVLEGTSAEKHPCGHCSSTAMLCLVPDGL